MTHLMSAPTIPLSPEAQTRLTVACELEAAGFPLAAKWLREHIDALKHVNWDEDPVSHVSIPEAWARLFSARRGSVPPTPQPIVQEPAPRADQVVAKKMLHATSIAQSAALAAGVVDAVDWTIVPSVMWPAEYRDKPGYPPATAKWESKGAPFDEAV